MPDTPDKPPAPKPPPPEDLGWDELTAEQPPEPDPLDGPWSTGDEEGTEGWEEEPSADPEPGVDEWEEDAGETALDDNALDRPPTYADDEPEAWAEDPDDPGIDGGWLQEADAPVIAGWSERASLPAWGIHNLPARLSTIQETSTLHVDLRPGLPGRVTLVLGEQTVDAGVGQLGEDLVARTTVRVVGKDVEATLRLVGTSGPPRLVLGRDLLAGNFLVDPSLSWTGRSHS